MVEVARAPLLDRPAAVERHQALEPVALTGDRLADGLQVVVQLCQRRRIGLFHVGGYGPSPGVVLVKVDERRRLPVELEQGGAAGERHPAPATRVEPMRRDRPLQELLARHPLRDGEGVDCLADLLEQRSVPDRTLQREQLGDRGRGGSVGDRVGARVGEPKAARAAELAADDGYALEREASQPLQERRIGDHAREGRGAAQQRLVAGGDVVGDQARGGSRFARIGGSSRAGSSAVSATRLRAITDSRRTLS